MLTLQMATFLLREVTFLDFANGDIQVREVTLVDFANGDILLREVTLLTLQMATFY